mgnify:CR=1 FL=1
MSQGRAPGSEPWAAQGLRVRKLSPFPLRWLSFVLITSLAFASSAQADLIERVVAVVNDEAILLSELRRRAMPYLEALMQIQNEQDRMQKMRQLYRQILDQLIDEELVEQAARKMKVRVSDEDLDRAIRNVRLQNRLSEEQFWAAVREQGFNEATYRVDLRRQLLRLKVLNQRVRGRVRISEEDVKQRYEDEVRRATRQLRFRASHILVGMSDNPSASEVAEARKKADALKPKVNASNFDKLAEEVGGGELGWLSQGDLPRPMEQALLGLSPGQISDPVRGPGGFHILLLHERERGSKEVPSYEVRKEEIYREMLESAMAKQERSFLEELHHQAVISRRL